MCSKFWRSPLLKYDDSPCRRKKFVSHEFGCFPWPQLSWSAKPLEYDIIIGTSLSNSSFSMKNHHHSCSQAGFQVESFMLAQTWRHTLRVHTIIGASLSNSSFSKKNHEVSIQEQVTELSVLQVQIVMSLPTMSRITSGPRLPGPGRRTVSGRYLLSQCTLAHTLRHRDARRTVSRAHARARVRTYPPRPTPVCTHAYHDSGSPINFTAKLRGHKRKKLHSPFNLVHLCQSGASW